MPSSGNRPAGACPSHGGLRGGESMPQLVSGVLSAKFPLVKASYMMEPKVKGKGSALHPRSYGKEGWRTGANILLCHK